VDTADTSQLLARGMASSRRAAMQPSDLPVPSPPALPDRDTPGSATPRQDPAEAFFSWLATTLPATDAAALVITHVLPGQLDFLAAFDRAARVAAVLPKPWSVNQAELARTAAGYRCDHLDRALCADPAWLARYVAGRAGRRRVVLLDEGGYFAPVLTGLCAALPGQVAGVVEDTENGHRAVTRRSRNRPAPCTAWRAAR
jgi:adenosylhomocysteinase